MDTTQLAQSLLAGNDNQASVQLITTIVVAMANVVLVALTAAYVIFTRKMVIQMKSAREPAVYVDLELPDDEMRIAIRNSGLSAARNVRFEVTDKIPWRVISDHPSGINAVEAIKRGVSFLPPGRTLKYMAGYIDWPKLTQANATVAIRVIYTNDSGEDLSTEYLIDVTQYNSILYESFRDPGLAVANAIRDADRNQNLRQQSQAMITRVSQPSTKPCPFCGESIRKAAKKCRYCLELLPSE